MKKSKMLKKKLNYHFWYNGDNNLFPQMNFHFDTEQFNKDGIDHLGRKRYIPSKRILRRSSYYLPYLTFRGFGEWFDSFGNLLAVLSGIADNRRAGKVLNFVKRFGVAKPHPIKAIYPSIHPGEYDWRDYYRFNKLNLPDQYHNGGIWPYLGGFYVAVLVKMKRHKEAEKTLVSLALLNKKGKEPWEFGEWFHGKTAKPKGMAEQAWSAGIYSYTYNAVREKRVRFF